MNKYIIGRQQILNRESNIYAYELLFRSNNFDLFDKQESALATNQIITNSIKKISFYIIVPVTFYTEYLSVGINEIILNYEITSSF